MSLGLSDRQARARRQLIWGLVKWSVALAGIGLAGLFAYRTGTSLAELDVTRLKERVAALSAQIETLQTDNTNLKAAAAQAQAQAKHWEQRYAADVPTGNPKAILDLAARKLAEGVAMDRLTFLINAAANPRVCDDKPEVKRVIVKTPLNKPGKDGAIAFADRKITITIDGQSVVNAKGQKEAWFDPAQPITLHIAELGGKTTDAAGVIPLQQTLISGDSEFSFAVAADDKRGFAVVTAQRCNFP
jgi:FtsZ-binding cell division protein ZapB